MAAPEYVPVKPMDDVRSYESPPRRPEPWLADRPGDLPEGQPRGARFGNPGPDQGYALALARLFEAKLKLQPGEHRDDAVHGCVAIALKRASMFGRAPVVHDLEVAFRTWGFLDEDPPVDLVAARRPLFAEVSNPLHYAEQRRVVDATPERSLRLTPAMVTERYKADWRYLLPDLD